MEKMKGIVVKVEVIGFEAFKAAVVISIYLFLVRSLQQMVIGITGGFGIYSVAIYIITAIMIPILLYAKGYRVGKYLVIMGYIMVILQLNHLGSLIRYRVLEDIVMDLALYLSYGILLWHIIGKRRRSV